MSQLHINTLLILVSHEARSAEDIGSILAPALAAAALDVAVQVILLGPGVSHALSGPVSDSCRQWGAVAELCGQPILADQAALTARLNAAEDLQICGDWVEARPDTYLRDLLAAGHQVLHV